LTSAYQVELRKPNFTDKLLASFNTVFLNKHFWFISISSFIRYGSLITVQGFLGTLYLVDVMRYSAQKSANILSMISVGYMIGSPLMGRISDSIFNSRKKVMVIGLFIYMCFMPFFLLDIDNEFLWYIVFWSLGFFASVGAVSFAHVKELFSEDISGVVLTANNLFNIGGVAISQQVVGLIVARYPKTLSGHTAEAYHSAFAVLSASCVIGFLLYLLVKDTRPLASDVL